MFNALGKEIHAVMRSKGFYDRETIKLEHGDEVYGDVENPSLPAEKLMLIVSECSEALAALREGSFMHEAEEVADILIRVLDYAEWRDIDLDFEVSCKMQKNRDREHLHGKQF